MVPKFAASNDLKISQVEVISECEGSRLAILCLQFLSDLQFDFHNDSPLEK